MTGIPGNINAVGPFDPVISPDGTKLAYFHDSDTKPASEEFWKPIGSGEITRAQDRLAVLRGGTNIGNGGMAEGKGNTIVTYAVSLPGLPEMECVMSGVAGGEFGKPTWSPDGGSLTWDEGDGIWTIAIGRDCSGTPRLVIPGGSDPDWGPAGDGGGGPGPGPAGPTVRVPRSIAAGGKLKISVTCAGSCRATATARAGGRVVAKAAKRLTGGGKLSLRPRRLRGARRLAVKVTVKPDGGAAATVTRKVQVRR